MPKLMLKKEFAVLILSILPWTMMAQTTADDPQRSPAEDLAKTAVLTNQSVVDMVNSRLPTDVILMKIQTSTTAFDLSIEALAHLNSAGVSGEVIKAMMRKNCSPANCAGSGHFVYSRSNDPVLPHAPGIYLYSGNGAEAKMTPLEPTTYSQTRTSGAVANGLTLGILPTWTKSVVPGAHAGVRLPEPSPTFYFYFDTRLPAPNCTLFCANHAPHEFTLLKLDMRDNRREVLISKNSIVRHHSGPNPNNSIPFVSEKIGAGIYKVTLTGPLPAGEYCFLNHAPGVGWNRLFDFSNIR